MRAHCITLVESQKTINNFFRNILVFLFLAFPFSSLFAEKPIVIVTTSHNNKANVAKQLQSFLCQDYVNYRVIYVDDASTDGTYDIAKALSDADIKRTEFVIIRNDEQRGPLCNIYHTVHQLCQNEEIVLCLDGSQLLCDNQALKKIDQAYSFKDVWITKDVPEDKMSENTIQNELQQEPTGHCRTGTFYAWLFKQIEADDLKRDGEFYKKAWLQAIMHPLYKMGDKRGAILRNITGSGEKEIQTNYDSEFQSELDAILNSATSYEPVDEACTGIHLCCRDARNLYAINYVGSRPVGGATQLQLLLREGLKKSDYVLDIGSGALVTSIPFMSFLEKGHYVGIDPNPWLMEDSLKIEENKKIVEACEPTFLQREDFNAQSTGITFDYVYAHSIMSHAAHSQLILFLKNTAQVLREGGKAIFSIRLTEPNEYGNPGAPKETKADTWQYPHCSFFDKETIIREGKKWFRVVEHKPEHTGLITSTNQYAYHDWFVLTK